MKLTPLDIQNHQFKITFRGFNVREVDHFLEEVADAMESLQRENESLRDKINRLKHSNEGYKAREETFKKVMLNSHKALEQLKKNAQKSAELMVAEAEVKADSMLQRAHNRLAQLHEEIAELKRQRIQLETQIRAVLESHSKLLDAGQMDMRASDEEDSKMQLLKKS
ncbi:MAG: DivIVA domain-containing protein [Desulfobacterales bacterium]|nr:DivIVA domain-containing protein [Desulfobacterales bacterium]MDJ0915165.1 DivIVA domain-containing protein [Desulfobacterales bacterium]